MFFTCTKVDPWFNLAMFWCSWGIVCCLTAVAMKAVSDACYPLIYECIRLLYECPACTKVVITVLHLPLQQSLFCPLLSSSREFVIDI